ncbi:glucosaminidase domain-containing protein [Enterococcus pallens]|uniref:Mannosyl-glycoprotein endo-beta-N-acetylglucosamidase-like domain-containing protein n=1 Tax=Enterococcus pallens ATCC BAA-351 TaxID=1158607 RepID=R2SD97_9ENTE|nr:glucosaminidase domain-containing protein [Enterococcus pallens]EOH86124.1 hypothetical protein UAU_05313 [Enterococcus pallens ATCC BAA-351]EOU09491.1 hypothetical protein I588_05224 [Enterococcus pallens ATCC BAA-351]
MNGKVLLGSFLLVSTLLLAGCQDQKTETVSAETKGVVQQQNTLQEKTVLSSKEKNALVQTVNESSESASTPESTVSAEKNGSQSTLPSSEESNEVSSSEAPEVPIQTSSQAPEATADSAEPAVVSEPIQEVPPALPVEKVEENYQFSVTKNQTTEEFIQTIGKDAQQIAWKEDLYASVMIAQAILETGSGNSQLARPPHHNLFGIKGSYQGKKVSFATQEDKGNGQLYTIQSSFRQYPSYKESLEDYASLLKNGLSGNSSFYQAVWKKQAATYQEATKALTGSYATDTSYDKKLNALIETYQLTSYDKEPNAEEEDSSEETVNQKETETAASESNQASENSETEQTRKSNLQVSETKQPVKIIPPLAQRPAKQVTGKRMAQ